MYSFVVCKSHRGFRDLWLHWVIIIIIIITDLYSAFRSEDTEAQKAECINGLSAEWLIAAGTKKGER